MEDWFIYGLRLNGSEIRYIGATRSLEKRAREHLYDAFGRGKKHPVQQWIRSLPTDSVIEVVCLESGAGDGRDLAERRWISSLRMSSPRRLLNVLDGGLAFVPPAARKQAGEKLKGRYFSPEHRRRISEAKKGCKRPDVAARNIALGPRLKGKKLNITPEERIRRSERGRKVIAKLRQNLTDDQRRIIAEKASRQMIAEWQRRRGAVNEHRAREN